MSTHLATCMLCEASCGLAIDVVDGRAARIAADRDDPFSRGHICPKAAGLDDVREDPDRVVYPMRRTRAGFARVSWDDALAEAAERLGGIQERHGRDAVALYYGNPIAHSYSALLAVMGFWLALGTRSRFSATSLDQLPHMLASLEMFGHQALLPVPDIDRTQHMLIVGANPLVSNGSLMTAPGVGDRLKAISARGGAVVVVDPRRTETAEVADRHVFIRPGTDALLLLAMIHVVTREGLARLGAIGEFADGLAALTEAAAAYTPDAVAAATTIPAGEIARMARDFARAPSAACYTRVGACTQPFGALVAWLGVALTAVTGNLDRPGGLMFAKPAVDLVALAKLVGQTGSFGAYRSRVRGLPEFGGELPAAALAEEIEAPGAGQIRGLVTVAGNPCLSAPNGPRLSRALAGLDFMVSLDLYQNETTRHANLILPSPFGLERDHYDLLIYAVAVRNVARYAPALFTHAGETRSEWSVLTELAARMARRPAGLRGTARRVLAGAAGAAFGALGPERVLDLLLRTGPYGLSLDRLRREPHGIDLGALAPRLPGALGSRGKRVALAPRLYLDELPKLREAMLAPPRADGPLSLIGRRSLRSNNSWMHNVERLVKGPERCTLRMHPDDAAARGLADGERVAVSSRVGEVHVPLQVSDEMARGVVSLPHGYGHGGAGVALRVANAHAGASVNALTDELLLDSITGTASFSTVPVTVARAAAP